MGQLKRDILDELIAWKKRADRKPIILTGVRQCGKTYALVEFGREHYEDVAYFNFEGNQTLAERFSENLDPKRILLELGVLRGKPIQPGNTLLILDEIQFCGPALTALKYFQESTPEYDIACAGSLLGIALSKPSSFPVGKVDFLTMRPLSFREFIIANDGAMLAGYLENASLEPIPEIFAMKLRGWLKTYFVTGGMPEVVVKWLESGDTGIVDRIQDSILNSYVLDFAKHAPSSDFPKLSLIWNSIPDQMAKESGKFVFGHVRKGARAKDLEDAMQWLIDAQMAHKVCRISKPGMPLSAYADPGYFKLYLCDVGLLRRMTRLPASAILEESALYTEFKGALTENFVLCELMALIGDAPFCWKSENTAEVDFVAQLDGEIVPFEVKAATNVKARSLGIYRKAYAPNVSIRTSMLNLRREDGLLNIPLYMLWTLSTLVKKCKP